MLVKVRRILKLGLLPVNDSLGSYRLGLILLGSESGWNIALDRPFYLLTQEA